MIDVLTQKDQSLADQLAAACGAGDLCAAAAIDAEEGDKFLQARLPDQMAAAHLLTMRLAALADRAISAAADGAAHGTDNRPLFDLAALRVARPAPRPTGRDSRWGTRLGANRTTCMCSSAPSGWVVALG